MIIERRRSRRKKLIMHKVVYYLSLDYKTNGTPRKTNAMTNKCRHNIYLQEKASRNEYQYNAATIINKYIVSKS